MRTATRPFCHNILPGTFAPWFLCTLLARRRTCDSENDRARWPHRYPHSTIHSRQSRRHGRQRASGSSGTNRSQPFNWKHNAASLTFSARKVGNLIPSECITNKRSTCRMSAENIIQCIRERILWQKVLPLSRAQNTKLRQNQKSKLSKLFVFKQLVEVGGHLTASYSSVDLLYPKVLWLYHRLLLLIKKFEWPHACEIRDYLIQNTSQYF